MLFRIFPLLHCEAPMEALSYLNWGYLQDQKSMEHTLRSPKLRILNLKYVNNYWTENDMEAILQFS